MDVLSPTASCHSRAAETPGDLLGLDGVKEAFIATGIGTLSAQSGCVRLDMWGSRCGLGCPDWSEAGTWVYRA